MNSAALEKNKSRSKSLKNTRFNFVWKHEL